MIKGQGHAGFCAYAAIRVCMDMYLDYLRKPISFQKLKKNISEIKVT